MKKNVVVYVLFVVAYTLLVVILTSSKMESVEIIVRFLINFIATFVVYVVANFALNYKSGKTKKMCLLHAFFLATLACVIAITYDSVKGNNVNTGSAIVSENTVTNEETTEGDVQMEVVFSEQDTSSRISQIFLDTIIAYIGGYLALYVNKKRMIEVEEKK